MGEDNKSLFKVAPRRTQEVDRPKTPQEPISGSEAQPGAQSPELLAKSPKERQAARRIKSGERTETASRLKALKRSKERETKHYINIAVGYTTKRALETAAHEHGLKMSEIMRDALTVYLRSAGYLSGEEE